jgi:hypothetical protein
MPRADMVQEGEGHSWEALWDKDRDTLNHGLLAAEFNIVRKMQKDLNVLRPLKKWYVSMPSGERFALWRCLEIQSSNVLRALIFSCLGQSNCRMSSRKTKALVFLGNFMGNRMSSHGSQSKDLDGPDSPLGKRDLANSELGGNYEPESPEQMDDQPRKGSGDVIMGGPPSLFEGLPKKKIDDGSQKDDAKYLYSNLLRTKQFDANENKICKEGRYFKLDFAKNPIITEEKVKRAIMNQDSAHACELMRIMSMAPNFFRSLNTLGSFKEKCDYISENYDIIRRHIYPKHIPQTKVDTQDVGFDKPPPKLLWNLIDSWEVPAPNPSSKSKYFYFSKISRSGSSPPRKGFL